MTTRAYILIETVVGRTAEVSAALDAMPAMTRVDTVTGPYDVIAIVEAEDLPSLGNLISDSAIYSNSAPTGPIARREVPM